MPPKIHIRNHYSPKRSQENVTTWLDSFGRLFTFLFIYLFVNIVRKKITTRLLQKFSSFSLQNPSRTKKNGSHSFYNILFCRRIYFLYGSHTKQKHSAYQLQPKNSQLYLLSHKEKFNFREISRKNSFPIREKNQTFFVIQRSTIIVRDKGWL